MKDKEPVSQTSIVESKGVSYECTLLPSGAHSISAINGHEDSNDLPYIAWAAAELSRKIQKPVRIVFSGKYMNFDFSANNSSYDCEVPSLHTLLEKAFDANHQEKVRQARREWMAKSDIIKKFANLVNLLAKVDNLGPYQNLTESEDARQAIFEMLNNPPSSKSQSDPLVQAFIQIHELATDLEKDGETNGAQVYDYHSAIMIVVNKALRDLALKKNSQLN